MKIRAYAKVNLYLAVISKRNDGFHDILSLMHNVSLYDTLEIKEGKERFKCNVDLEWNDTNTLYRTLRLFEEKTGIHASLEIELTKRIPMKAGLGGASSDAAALIWYLCERYSKMEVIFDLAREVGSDVPFFVKGGCALVQGKGEKITTLAPLNLPLCFFFPDEGFSTPQMYNLIDKEGLLGKVGDPMALYEALKKKDIKNASLNTYNAFEEVVKKYHPFILEKAHEELSNCDIVAMTGSGSAFYGLKFEDKANEGFHLSASPRDVFY